MMKTVIEIETKASFRQPRGHRAAHGIAGPHKDRRTKQRRTRHGKNRQWKEDWNEG